MTQQMALGQSGNGTFGSSLADWATNAIAPGVTGLDRVVGNDADWRSEGAADNNSPDEDTNDHRQTNVDQATPTVPSPRSPIPWKRPLLRDGTECLDF